MLSVFVGCCANMIRLVSVCFSCPVASVSLSFHLCVVVVVVFFLFSYIFCVVVSSFIAPVTDLHSVVASLVYNNGLFGNFAPGQVYSHNLCGKPSVVILAVVKSRSNFILFCPDDQIFPKNYNHTRHHLINR